jgi:hypothetical protein
VVDVHEDLSRAAGINDAADRVSVLLSDRDAADDSRAGVYDLPLGVVLGGRDLETLDSRRRLTDRVRGPPRLVLVGGLSDREQVVLLTVQDPIGVGRRDQFVLE